MSLAASSRRFRSRVRHANGVSETGCYLSPHQREALDKHLLGKVVVSDGGVVAAETLPTGTQLPFVGHAWRGPLKALLSMLPEDQTHVVVDTSEEPAIAVDGAPQFAQHKACVANRVKDAARPNCEWRRSVGWARQVAPLSIVTKRTLPSGRKLTVSWSGVKEPQTSTT